MTYHKIFSVFMCFVFMASGLKSQNAYFEAVRLNEAYKARDYKSFFQLLADQPDVSEQFKLLKGQSVSYSDLYGYYASTAFLKPSLDTMMKLKNDQLANVKASLASMQVEKTQLLSVLDNALQAEIEDYLLRKKLLEALRDDVRSRNFQTTEPYRQLKTAIEATILTELIPFMDSVQGFGIAIGATMDDFESNDDFTLPDPNSPYFAQLKSSFLAVIDDQILAKGLAAQRIQQYKEQIAAPPAKALNAFEARSVVDVRPYLTVYPADSLKKKSRRLIKLNIKIQEAEKQKVQREREEAAGLVTTMLDEGMIDGPSDAGPELYYTPSVIERPRLNTVVIGGGGSFESDLLDATAGFIAERMKEELNVAFFEKFMTVLERPAVRTLFPTTHDLLINTESYNYSVLLEVIKEAFEKDLRELAFHAPELMRQYPYDMRYRQEAAYAMIAGQVLTKATRGEHPMEIIRHLGQNNDSLLPAQFHQAFAFLNIVSNSLRDTVGMGNSWVGTDALGSIAKDVDLRRFYLGLLYKEMNDFARENEIVAGGATIAAFEDMNRFYALVSEFGHQVNSIEAQIRYIRQLRGSEQGVRAEDLLSFYRSLLGIVNFSVSAYLGGTPEEIKQFVAVNNSLIDIYGAVANKNYSLALISSMELIRLGLGDRLGNEEPEILRYGSFMVSLAKAENAEQIKSVIKAMALPVGSYGIKRRNFFNISLNAYPGLTGGMERAYNSDTSRWAFNGGFTAPVGLSFSWGYRRPVYNRRWERRPMVTLRDRRIDPNQRWEILADTSVVFYQKLTDSTGLRIATDSVRYSQFTEVRRRVDTFNSRTDKFLGYMRDTSLLAPHPRWTKRKNRIRRATHFFNNSGRERYLAGSSGSVFVSFIDLGALVLFRIDEATEPLPEDVRFRQVFAPGLFYAHGFRDIPISLLAGAQYSPQLRKFGDSSASALRFNLGLTVDIPMINFFTKTER